MITDLLETFGKIVYGALKQTYALHENIGDAGQAAVQKNAFGDEAMVLDIESEKVMIEALRRHDLVNLIHSEEHGIVEVPDSKSDRLAVMDGLDGSSVYKRARNEGLYGSMLTIYSSSNPTYDDYIVAGIAFHTLGQALIAVKGQGLRLIDMKTDRDVPIERTMPQSIGDGRIFVDELAVDSSHVLYDYFTGNTRTFGEPLRAAGYKTEVLGSSASYYGLLALGEASLVGESTRKGNLEHATAYALVTEAGGTVLDMQTGKSIGSELFLEFGQKTHMPTMAVASDAVASEALALLCS